MCAIEAGKRGKEILILDHANKIGKKILMSGGGKCNFTNLNINSNCYISNNPHFCKSALSRYTANNFIDLVKKHNIPYHEKIHGQLFCDNKSKDIVDMLLNECKKYNITIQLNTNILRIESLTLDPTYKFKVHTSKETIKCTQLVIASGGLSIPSMGSSPFGYQVAKQFDINVHPTRPGLVPLTLHEHDKEIFSKLSGISCHIVVQSNKTIFSENILFTHRGLSGPAILQISSYWQPGTNILINFSPNHHDMQSLVDCRRLHPNRSLQSELGQNLPKRLVTTLFSETICAKPLQAFNDNDLNKTMQQLNFFKILPNGTEGYRTAEVTLGGVDCDAISSKTMECKTVPGLYFIGEVLDVAGWLGGYNFQWAWASGFAAGQAI